MIETRLIEEGTSVRFHKELDAAMQDGWVPQFPMTHYVTEIQNQNGVFYKQNMFMVLVTREQPKRGKKK